VIFVTTGAQMPFDRLVRTVDEWAGDTGRDDVFAQIGSTQWRPKNIEWTSFLAPTEFRQKAEQASLLIAHAGTGSILTAMELQKPIIVMPRRGALRETRNDHQVDTARRFQQIGRIAVAMDENQLRCRLNEIESIDAPHHVGPFASDELLDAIRTFLACESTSKRNSVDATQGT